MLRVFDIARETQTAANAQFVAVLQFHIVCRYRNWQVNIPRERWAD